MTQKEDSHVWAGSQFGESAPCSPSHKTPGRSRTALPAGTLRRYLQEITPQRKIRHRRDAHGRSNQTRLQNLPSAPKSGLKDFFSLKFLKIFTTLLLSRIAYLQHTQHVQSDGESDTGPKAAGAQPVGAGRLTQRSRGPRQTPVPSRSSCSSVPWPCR